MNMKENEMNDPFFNYIKEFGKENPKDGFHEIVLSAIEKRQSVFTYSPVISSFAWKIISLLIFALIVSVFLLTSEGTKNIVWLEQFMPDYKSISSINLLSYFPKVTITPLLSITLAVFFLFSLFGTYLSTSSRKRMI